jgi:hypothetical protein
MLVYWRCSKSSMARVSPSCELGMRLHKVRYFSADPHNSMTDQFSDIVG